MIGQLKLPPEVSILWGGVSRQLRTAVATLERVARELEPERLGGAHAAALVEVVAQGARVCAAMKALLARRVEECGVWRADGARTAGHWLAEKTGVTVGAATQALQTARRLDELPATAEPFHAGSLSELQAHEITMAAGTDRSAEARLLGAARETGVKGLRDRCREVRVGAEDNDAAWARRLHDSRYAHDWSDPDGACRVEARMPPEDGARFRSAW